MAPGEEESIVEQKCRTRGSQEGWRGCLAQTNPFPHSDLRWSWDDVNLFSLCLLWGWGGVTIVTMEIKMLVRKLNLTSDRERCILGSKALAGKHQKYKTKQNKIGKPPLAGGNVEGTSRRGIKPKVTTN